MIAGNDELVEFLVPFDDSLQLATGLSLRLTTRLTLGILALLLGPCKQTISDVYVEKTHEMLLSIANCH